MRYVNGIAGDGERFLARGPQKKRKQGVCQII